MADETRKIGMLIAAFEDEQMRFDVTVEKVTRSAVLLQHEVGNAVRQAVEAALMGAILVGLVACSSNTNVSELARVRSPDGEYEAVLATMQAGGAAGTASVAVFMGSVNQPIDRQHPPVFEAVGCTTVPMDWVNSKNLTVSYAAACQVVGFHSRWYRPNPPDRDAFVDVEVKKIG